MQDTHEISEALPAEVTTDQATTPTALAIVNYGVSEADIDKWKAEYMALTVNGLDDVEGLALVIKAKNVLIRTRNQIEKKRETINKPLLNRKKANDTEAKRLTALIAPIERHLYLQEKAIEEQKEALLRAQEERTLERTIRLKTIDMHYDPMRELYESRNGDVTISMSEVREMDEVTFDNFFAEADQKNQADRVAFQAFLAEKNKSKTGAVIAIDRAETTPIDIASAPQAEDPAHIQQEHPTLTGTTEARDLPQQLVDIEQETEMRFAKHNGILWPLPATPQHVLTGITSYPTAVINKTGNVAENHNPPVVDTTAVQRDRATMQAFVDTLNDIAPPMIETFEGQLLMDAVWDRYLALVDFTQQQIRTL